MNNPGRLIVNILLVLLAEFFIGSAIYAHFSAYGLTYVILCLLGVMTVIIAFLGINDEF